MSSETRNTLYNPLDRSQISFIPAELSSINDSLGDSAYDTSSAEKDYFDSMSLKRTVTNNTSSVKTFPGSSQEESDRLTKLSTRDSLGSDIIDRIRYKIVLNLSPREIQLIRNSWTMMLTDDISTERTTALFRKLDKLPTVQQPQPPATSQPGGVAAAAGVPSAQRRPASTTASSVAPSLSSGAASMVSQPATPAPALDNVNTNTIASSLFCAQFYANLLDMDANLEKLYPSIKHQAVAYAGVLTTAISHLENLSLMDGYLSDLGKRHNRILGIEPPHFELMGIAFLKTIQDRFGIYCTIELTETWSRLYSYLANSILQFGIDPVLELNHMEEEIIFPIPNLIEQTPTTKAPLTPAEIPQAETPAHNPPALSIPAQKATAPSLVPPHHPAISPSVSPASSSPKSLPSKQVDSPSANKRVNFYKMKRKDGGDKDCILM
ncbi:ABL201Wp [Eremothecium gossypii ATCC 10895]|uniref:ABL201Wp n=1 Tax=Eremothecium gossypii (strain ATCC 10895 / CBS 109.51 / FGSC 9923 / NRRL Y-1056) TaxID=284811 RepID=Q75E71_EREGS|nr:ABL201Wp [Eremothecium gossypii ATCC 10895]AAS50570.1 ABL201Wp [Eremothecium gossypii ATCC 10895]AEY94858.1 FABL201Wp [Eremothecium gossypii FDAG1]